MFEIFNKLSKCCIIVILNLYNSNISAQFRFIQAHSEIEDRLIGLNIQFLDGYRQNRQTSELISNLNTLENWDTSFGKRSFPFFSWNNPEFSGYRKTKFTASSSIRKIMGTNGLQNPNRFYMWKAEDGEDYFVVNPIIDGSLGIGFLNLERTLQNGRGVEIMGQFGKDLTFYSKVLDYQALFPNYLKSYSNTKQYRGHYNFPGLGQVDSNFLGYSDYFIATGYLDAKILEKRNSFGKIRYKINGTIGYDKQQLGFGYRSLILSDFAAPTSFLSIKYKLGPFEYQNLFKELIRDMSTDSFRAFNKKFLAIHRGSLNFPKIGFEIGFTEMIVQTRPNNGLDLSYFNPIILYRSVERDLGSPDNAFIALDAKVSKGNFSFYGQFVIDEFYTKEVFTNPNSAYNKFGEQIGFYYNMNKTTWNCGYMNFEYNQARPYMYSHNSANHYTNRLQSLAHPLESNFRELVYRLYLVPRKYPRWAFKLTSLLSWKGYDQGNKNYGGNILNNYETAVDIKNAPILQGNLQRRIQILTTMSYYLQPNAKLELNYQFYRFSGYEACKNQNISIGFKLNFTENRESIVF